MATKKPRVTSRGASAKKSITQIAEVEFGREICGVLDVAEQREWLVTNGMGGFASGTVSGNLTRRYHGLLVAALHPPVGRMQLVAKLDETVRYDSLDYALSTNRWGSGAIEPHGYVHIESFRLDGTTPVWRFAIGDALLEKRVWMRHGENTTYVRYAVLRGSQSMELELSTLINYRDFHSNTHAGDWHMKIDLVKSGLQITAFEDAIPFYLLCTNATAEPRHEWCRDYFLPLEKYRGLDDREDYLLAAVFRATLQVNQSVTIVFSTNTNAALDGDAARVQNVKREADLLTQWSSADAPAASAAPIWVPQLILAADRFVVKRDVSYDPEDS